MKKYAILCHPQAIKAYKEDAGRIFLNELKAIAKGMDTDAGDSSFDTIAQVPYIIFECENEPPKSFFSGIARHSAFYAAFEVRGEALLPQEAEPGYIFNENMPSLLNYQGKTNEYFTRLMLNLAISACGTNPGGKLSLLDPVAGKGTTLYDALMMGHDAYGIEIMPKFFMESCHYAAKFMQNAKFKHITKKDKILDARSKKIADAYTLEFAPDKKSFSAKDTGIFKIFCADTGLAGKLLKNNSIDMIVGDLPYGIQHAGRKNAAKGTEKRGAEALFAEALPAWLNALKPRGALVVSFNLNTASKENMALIAEKNGLKVLKEDEYSDYFHRVDASIRRDLIAAVKL